MMVGIKTASDGGLVTILYAFHAVEAAFLNAFNRHNATDWSARVLNEEMARCHNVMDAIATELRARPTRASEADARRVITALLMYSADVGNAPPDLMTLLSSEMAKPVRELERVAS